MLSGSLWMTRNTSWLIWLRQLWIELNETTHYVYFEIKTKKLLKKILNVKTRGGGGGTGVNIDRVRAAGLSKPLPHLSQSYGQS